MSQLLELIKNLPAGKAIPHFNCSTIDVFHAIVEASLEKKCPVIVGVAEKEELYMGRKEMRALVDLARSKNPLIFLNADHHYTFEAAKACLDDGFDMIVIDGAKLPMDENIELVKRVVEYNKKSKNGAVIEAEIGYIGVSSQVHDEAPQEMNLGMLTTPQQAIDFIEQTGVDSLAPAVGNIHGIIVSGQPPLDIDRISEISQIISVPIVLHGASGNSDVEIKHAIMAGVKVIHVNTEIRVAYKAGIQEFFEKDNKEVAPYKYLALAKEKAKQVILSKMEVFGW
jgi:fructose-bisphosphate aldolase, class II